MTFALSLKKFTTGFIISLNTINTAKMYARINGYGCLAAPKPPMYGYDVFFDLTNLVHKEVDNLEQQTYFISELENQKHYLKLQYCQYLKINYDSTVQHDTCINHCLPFAFEECNKIYSSECKECSQIFSLFRELYNALKHNQKYKKKGDKKLSKDVVEALKRFFILGQANSSNCYTTSDMHNGLLELVESKMINEENVSTQNTIENWINHYLQESKKEAAEQALLTYKQ
ncbi:5750_t:CDS:2 [Cetraspora pellucida]|uniref:5750_t:CDS:1 n=1 Tax=Cetraspora pellucida TaxID=1433469 RepID=A0ACA9K474_9GLOM|nr:5750_t:CDS:2 [Cetraspora pellucida]